MKYSTNEVMQYVREEDVKFIRLAFCDVFGKQKNISIMAEELRRVVDHRLRRRNPLRSSAASGRGNLDAACLAPRAYARRANVLEYFVSRRLSF